MQQFYLYCMSNASMLEYPQNTLTNFTNILPHTLNFDSETWAVALQAFSFEHAFVRQPPQLVKIWMSEVDPTHDSNRREQNLIITPYRATADVRFYFEVKQKQYLKIKSSNLRQIQIKLTDEDDEQLNMYGGQATLVKLRFTKMPQLGNILRVKSDDCMQFFPDNTLSNFRVQVSTLMNLSRENWEVALSSIFFPAIINHVAGLIPSSILLYSSIVEPSIVGASFVHILKMIPLFQSELDNTRSVYAIHECQHLDFIKLSQSNIQLFDFQLRDSGGEEIKFSYPWDPVIINLVFRQIKH